MSLNDNPKRITKNESNIPVPKSSGRTKSKVRSQFPELQKYIETIINASNRCDSEDGSEKGEKTSKVGKSGNIATQNENKKFEKRKFNFNFNSEKVKERTKTTVSVSSRENISNQFFSDFEDPRNWDIVTTHKDFHKNLKIEKALKTLFPNPYKLLQSPEFNKSKISMYIAKIGNDDVTLTDVIISEFDARKKLDSTRVESIFEADYDKSSSQMDLGTLNSSSSVKSRSSKIFDDGKVSSFSDSWTLHAISNFARNQTRDKSNKSTSRQSSLENLKDCDSTGTEKKRVQGNLLKSSRGKTSRERKSSDERLIDYDIGKLKLLTMTDSDDSSKDLPREKDEKLAADFRDQMSTRESSHNSNKLLLSRNGMREAGIVKEFLSELTQKHTVNQTEARNRSKSDGVERVKLVKCKIKVKRKKSIKNNCPNAAENDSENCEERKLEMSKPSNAAGMNKEAKAEDDGDMKPSEKIDEVLKFMCSCYPKLENGGEPMNENSMKKTDVEEIRGGEKRSKLKTPPSRNSSKSKPDLPTIERLEASKASAYTPNSRRHNKSAVFRSEKKFHQVRSDHAVVSNPNVPDTVYPDSAAINNGNVVQTVETQNELGGYTEEQHRAHETATNICLTKSILPLSLRTKKTKMNTYNVLKNALEKEEGLLNGEFNLNRLSSRNNFFEKPMDALTKDSHTSCSVVGAFKSQHSNFVVCVNSLPRNMRIRNPMGFSLCPWTICLGEIPRPLIYPLPYHHKIRSEKVKLDREQFVTRLAYKADCVFISYRCTVLHILGNIGLSFVMGTCKVRHENLLKKSENRIRSKYKPTIKSFYVKPSAPPKAVDCVIESCQKVDLDLSLNLDDQVGALEEAVEETEKVYFLEQNCGATYTLSETTTSSRNDTFKNFEWNDENEKRKLHDLLMRTYNLQQKLQQHLKRLTGKQTSLSCPLIQQEPNQDYEVEYRNSEVLLGSVDNSSEDAMVYWFLQTLPKSNVLDEAVSVDIQKTDHSTSYDPPSREKFKKMEDIAESGDDDRSSTYSFKSSNDLSEGERDPRAPKPKKKIRKHVQFLQNIFNEIELFKNRIMSERKKEKEFEIINSETKDWTETRLTESSEGMKSPSKMLKTVFKGKESLTELSLGLKAVPLAKVSNISVEKKKISDNHTKISICIAKETAGNELSEDQTSSREMMRNRLSHYLNSLRPSLSSCPTDYSMLENQACQEESEDEEDEFKSVASSLSREHLESNSANQVTEVEKAETSAPKSFAKHRFDFYQKMDTSTKMRRKSTSNTSCTYKEFEPLKQALTEMQIRMRSIKRDAYFSSNDYYERALKLAKMSAGYCQSCGSRSVIPQDTFGYYNKLLPRNQWRHRGRNLKATPPHSSYYSLRSSLAELSDQFCDLDLRESSSYLLNSSRTIIRNSVKDIPIYSGTI